MNTGGGFFVPTTAAVAVFAVTVVAAPALGLLPRRSPEIGRAHV